MANYLQREALLPIYLIFSAISPRDEAISRLKRAGWNFLIGESAITFAEDLLGLNLAQILNKPHIKAEIQREVNEMMKMIFNSHAFQQVVSIYKG